MKDAMKWSHWRIALLVACCLPALNTSTFAAWRMEVESKTVSLGQTSVSLGVTYAWEVAIVQATLPIVVRSIDPGSFWTGNRPYDTTDSDGNHLVNGVSWNSIVPPWASIIREVRPGPGCEGSGPYDGISPDFFVINTQGLNGLAAKPAGIVFVTLSFGVTSQAGQFEFDTACFSENLNRIFMVDKNGVDHGPDPGTNEVQFSKGIITLNSPGNDAPMWLPIDSQYVEPGDTLIFRVAAVDPEGSHLDLVAEDIPLHATFSDSGNGAGALIFHPEIAQGGTHNVRFIASDGSLADTMVVRIVVNQAPVLAPLGPFVVIWGEQLSFTVSAVDSQGTIPTIAERNLPTGASFRQSKPKDGTASFDWLPMASQMGIYSVGFIARDSLPLFHPLADTMWVTIVVQGPTGVLSENENVPVAYSLSQNYPNPFNASTLIEFSLEQPGMVRLDVFNILGQRVATPVDEFRSAGVHSARWNGKDAEGKPVASGMYFYRLTTGEFSEVRKMVLLK